MPEEQYVLNEDAGTKAQQAPDDKLPEVVVELVGKIEDVPAGTIKNALVKLSVTDVALATVKAGVLETLAKWDGSKASYEVVKRARLDLVPLRVAVEKEAKEGRAEALAVQRLWLTAEKSVTGFYADLEAQLAAKEFEYTEVIRKAAEEKARIERERVTKMYDQLKAYDWPGNELICAQYTPEQFESELAKSRANWETVQAAKKAEADRIAKEAKDREEQAEKNRLEAVRLEEVAKGQREAQARLDAQQKAIEDQKAAALKEIQDAKDKDEADRKAAQDEADRKERERVAAEEREAAAKKAEADREQREAEETARIAALAPDKEKVVEWCRTSWTAVSHVPTLADPYLTNAVDTAAKEIDSILTNLRIAAGIEALT